MQREHFEEDREIEQYKLCVEDGGDVQKDEAAEWVQARTFGSFTFPTPIFSQPNKAFEEKNF